MLEWLRSGKESLEPFRWSADRVSQLTSGFHVRKDSGARQLTLGIAITQVLAERSSWDLEVEHKIFGWVLPHKSLFWMGDIDGIPVQVNVVPNKDVYSERSSREPEKLPSLGSCYLWDRSSSSDMPDGFEVGLYLDRTRYKAAFRALYSHRSIAPMFLSVGLWFESKHDKALPGPFPVWAYWISNWPLDATGPAKHPWAKHALD